MGLAAEKGFEDVMPGRLRTTWGGFFKLDGIQLFNGNDIVTIYRMSNQSTTSIELFKCRDALAH